MTAVRLIPGLWNSGPEHWQSHWERANPAWLRVQQADWETPRRDDWVRTIERTIEDAGEPVVLAAHSLGCATVAHLAAAAPHLADPARRGGRLHGALLVAPSDIDAPSYPPGTHGFQPMPLEPLPFPTIVVASTDDAYVSLARATQFARAWGSRLVVAGALGHINSASKLGMWPAGLALLEELLRSPSTPAST